MKSPIYSRGPYKKVIYFRKGMHMVKGEERRFNKFRWSLIVVFLISVVLMGIYTQILD